MKNLEKNCLLYGAYLNKTEFVSGSGSYLYDSEGKKYIDFFSGCAVTCLGHDSPIIKDAIKKQLDTGILFVSADDYNCSQATNLANKLCDLTFDGKVFFGSSGAESVELAIKAAKKYFNTKKKDQNLKPEIISFKNAFHGRTYAAISLSDMPNLYTGFEPIMPGVKFAELNNIESVKALINEPTAAIIIEPVRGEGALKILDVEFAKELRKLCDEHDIALIFDEVQCGNGRTGKIYAYKNFGIEPDIIATAKSLGGGFPISACIIKEKFANAMNPGSHGTTFGGGPLATSIGLAVLNEISKPEFLENANNIGKFIISELKKIQEKNPNIIDNIDGIGLMIAISFNDNYKNRDVIQKLLDNGLMTAGAKGNMVRFLPPLNLSIDDAKAALEIFVKVVSEL